MHAVAEGIETPAQEEMLRRLGCPFGQGYLWSPAVPARILPVVLDRLTSRGGTAPAVAVRRARARPRRSAAPDEATEARIVFLHASGTSPTTIAAVPNGDGILTTRGRRWQRGSVAQVIADRQYPDVPLVE